MVKKRKFKSVRRNFTPDERTRFDRGKRAAVADRQRLVARARARKAEFAELRRVMKLLKKEREAAGFSLTDIADKSGIDKSRLSKLENDPHPNPTLNTLSRIAGAIGVRITIGVEAA